MSKDKKGARAARKKQTVVKRATCKTRRRDDDPVRVFADNRVAYYPSGRVNVGKRKWKRHDSRAAAEAFASLKRAEFKRTVGAGPLADAPLVEVVRAMIAHLEATSAPEGTIRKYRSSFNVWIPKEVRQIPCAQLSMRHWTAVFDGLNTEAASPAVIKSVATMLGAVMNYGIEHEYWADEPFGPVSRRRSVKKRAIKTSQKQHGGSADQPIELDHCPTRADVEKYAIAFEALYPGYGRRLVLLAYASGLRLCELLALRTDVVTITDDEISIKVNCQLDRYNPWPATTLPKHNKRRTTIVWKAYRDVIESLVNDANAREGKFAGVLFPPLPSEANWADKVNNLSEQAVEAAGWKWTFHWTRHAFASVSMAPAPYGYGIDASQVAKWLGHSSVVTTLRTYRQPLADSDKAAFSATGELPA